MALASAETTIEFKVGSDVILPCQIPKTGVPGVLEWQKDGQSDYVIKYRKGESSHSLQNPSYRNRVKLVDEQMTDGNMSIKLSNATRVDEGRYTCRVVLGTEMLTTVQLKVEQDKPENGGDDNLGLKVGLPVVVFLIAVASIAVILYLRSKKGGNIM